MISSDLGETAASWAPLGSRPRKDPQWGPFLSVRSAAGCLVAASNATGHRRSIGAMDLRDLHRAVATCIRPAHIHRNARTVVATPVVVMPAVVTITPTILSGRRRCYRNQRQRCQSDKNCLHSAFSSSDEVQRFLCLGVPKNERK